MHKFIIILGAMLTAPALAHAATTSCAGAGDAPVSHDSAVCNGICYLDLGNTRWRCDLTGTGSSATAVVNYNSSSGRYSAWGSSGGSNFCCRENSTSLEYVELFGTTNADTLAFHYDSGGGLIRDLAHNNSGSLLVGKTHGNSGNDTITGSNTATVYYDEEHYGDAGLDTITCLSGDDIAYGGADADTITGDNGADDLYGEAGDDTLRGGPENDYIEGGSEYDKISGGANDDVMLGGTQDDVLCDTSGTDEFYGNDGNDAMYSSSGSTPSTLSDGGLGTDDCGDTDLFTTWAVSCTDSLATAPGTCPAP